jgi:hypothetical protein
MGYKVDQIFVIREHGEDARTEVGPDPDNSDFIKIAQISSSNSYYDSITMCREKAIKVAEAILKLTEMR